MTIAEKAKKFERLMEVQRESSRKYYQKNRETILATKRAKGEDPIERKEKEWERHQRKLKR